MVLHIDKVFRPAPKPPAHPIFEEDEEEEDEEMGWIFLFVDLVYVALLSKLSHVLEGCALSVHSFVFVITIFTVSFVTRLTIDDYACRFVTNDLIHRFAYFIYTMCNFIMTLNVNSEMPDEGQSPSDGVCGANIYSFGYSCGFLIARLVIVCLLIAVIYEDQRDRNGDNKDNKDNSDDDDDERREHVQGTGPLSIRVQLRLMLTDLHSKVFRLCRKADNNSVKFNSAFKQFAGTIFKLCLSSFIVIMLVSFEYANGPSKEGSKYYPRAQKIYIFVVAMMIEFGGHLLHFLVFDLSKMHMERDSKKKLLKEKDKHEYVFNHHPEVLQSIESAKKQISKLGKPVSHKLDYTNHLRDLSDWIDARTDEFQNDASLRESFSKRVVAKNKILFDEIIKRSAGDDLVEDDYYALRVVQYQERLGAFLMLVLGEAIIVLLLPYYDIKNARSAYFFSICSCWLLFLFGIQYFDAQNFKNETNQALKEEELDVEHHDHRHQHAMNHSALSRFLYVWLHLALAICVFFTSSSLGALYESAMHQIASDDGDDAVGDDHTPTPKPTVRPTYAPTLKHALGLGASFGSTHLRGLAGPAPVPAGASAGTSTAVKPQDDDDASNDDVSDDTWDHRPLVTHYVLFSTSVALFIIIVTITRSLHTGLEELFIWTPTDKNTTKKGGFTRFRNKLAKMLWALLHLTVGFWKMSTPARYVGAHCALLSVLTFFELGLRFFNPSHIAKVGHESTKKHALLKVMVGVKGKDKSNLYIYSAGHMHTLNLGDEHGEHGRSAGHTQTPSLGPAHAGGGVRGRPSGSGSVTQLALNSGVAGPRLSIGETRSRKDSAPVFGDNPMHAHDDDRHY